MKNIPRRCWCWFDVAPFGVSATEQSVWLQSQSVSPTDTSTKLPCHPATTVGPTSAFMHQQKAYVPLCLGSSALSCLEYVNVRLGREVIIAQHWGYGRCSGGVRTCRLFWFGKITGPDSPTCLNIPGFFFLSGRSQVCASRSRSPLHIGAQRRWAWVCRALWLQSTSTQTAGRNSCWFLFFLLKLSFESPLCSGEARCCCFFFAPAPYQSGAERRWEYDII